MPPESSPALACLAPLSVKAGNGQPSAYDEIGGFRCRLATLSVFSCQAGPLDPGDDQIGQFGRHLCRIAGGSDDIIIVIQSGETAKRLPENIRVAGLRHVRQTP